MVDVMAVKVVNSIEVSDYGKIKVLFSKREAGTCESIVNNTFIWRDYYKAGYMEDENGIVFINSIGDEVFASSPICEQENIYKCIKTAKKYFDEVIKKDFVIYVADEDTVSEIIKNGEVVENNENVRVIKAEDCLFEITEERDYFDYVYDAQKLKTFSGKKYHKKKNHLNAFLREFEGRYETKCMNCQDREEIFEFLDRWHNMRDIEDEYKRDEHELRGIKRFLAEMEDVYEKTNLYMYGVYVDKKLEAFTMGTYLEDKKELFVHVEKANPFIRGLYVFINSSFIKECFEDALLVNREDDMGISGLRQAKESLNPIAFEKKYTIRIKKEK